MPRPSNRLMIAAFGLICMIWGSTWLVIKEGLKDLPPLTSAGLRFALAAVVMAIYARVRYHPSHGAAPPAWLWLVMGSTNFAISYGIVYSTEVVLPSGLVSVLWAVYPLYVAILSLLLLPQERLCGSQWAGFLLSFVGILVLFLSDIQEFGSEGLWAALLLLVSPLATAVATLLVKRHGNGTSSVLLNRNAMCAGAGWLLLAGWISEDLSSLHWTGRAAFSLVYLAVLGTCVTFGLYFWLMRHWPAQRLSLGAYLTPCVALFLGVSFGGEKVAWHTMLGTGLILFGVALGVRPRPMGIRRP